MRYPYKVPSGQRFVEIIDNNDIPFMLIPQQEAMKKHLPHRHVCVLLRHEHEEKILLLPTIGTPSSAHNIPQHISWDVLKTCVYAAESREDAAARLLQETFHTESLAPTRRSFEHCMQAMTLQKTPMAHTELSETPQRTALQHTILNTTFFLYDMDGSCDEFYENKHHLWLDFDELTGLTRHFQDMFSHLLLFLVEEWQLIHACKHMPRIAGN